MNSGVYYGPPVVLSRIGLTQRLLLRDRCISVLLVSLEACIQVYVSVYLCYLFSCFCEMNVASHFL